MVEEAADHCLAVVVPDGTTAAYPLVRPRLVAGWAPDCEIVLDNDAISRHYAEIPRHHFGRRLIHDWGSRYGLKVNGVTEQALPPHLRVRLDKHHVDPNHTGILGFSAGGGVAIGTTVAESPNAYPDFVATVFGPAPVDVSVPKQAAPGPRHRRCSFANVS
jgi:hypothetical protein